MHDTILIRSPRYFRLTRRVCVAPEQPASLPRLCQEGDLEEVGFHLAGGGDVNRRAGNHRATSLMVAARRGHNSILALLLQQPGLEVDLADDHGQTALHYSCRGGNSAGLALLLAHPGLSSLDARDDKMETALMMAVKLGQLGCVELLVQVPGVELNCRDRCSQSLVSLARKSSWEMWRLVQGELVKRTWVRREEERRREKERREEKKRKDLEKLIGHSALSAGRQTIGISYRNTWRQITDSAGPEWPSVLSAGRHAGRMDGRDTSVQGRPQWAWRDWGEKGTA